MSEFVPKYKYISDDLKEKIRNKVYLYGENIPTEYELTNEYKVSRYTIRKALSILEETGYVVSKKGSGTYVIYKVDDGEIINELRDKTIGVITTHISEYIFPAIIRGIDDVLKKYNTTLILSSTNNDHNLERKHILSMIEKEVDGLIIEPTRSNEYNPNLIYYNMLKKCGIPYVLIHANYDLIESNVILFDDEKAGYDATIELINNGHKNIACIIKYDDKQGKYRLKGYLNALYENDIFIEDSIYIYTSHEEENAIKKFMKDYEKGKFSALFCYNDQIASKIISEMSKIEKSIPEDLSITSIDNSIISQNLAITSVNHPKIKLGIKAAEWLMESIMNKDSNTRKYVFTGNIKRRKSVKNISDN